MPRKPPHSVIFEDNVPANDYKALIRNISFVIENGRRYVVHHINVALIGTYWTTGRWIVEFEQKGRDRAEYGDSLLRQLEKDLFRQHGKGFSFRNLNLMRQFYLAYPIVQTVSAQSKGYADFIRNNFPLPWSHYCHLIRIENLDKRKFYEAESVNGNWSLRQLNRQIQALLYERTALSRRKQTVIARAHHQNLIERPEDAIKEPYVLDFLDLRDDYSESDLEDALIKHLENFLLELGEGFTFVARQKRFEIDKKQYRMDLVLYNRLLRSLYIVDLKIGDFEHGDAGQMNFYLNWAKANACFPGENNPIGLILCSGKNETYAQYVLGGMSNKIFVSKYQLNLPKLEDIRKELDETKKRFENLVKG